MAGSALQITLSGRPPGTAVWLHDRFLPMLSIALEGMDLVMV
jgi:hypothetical protein